MRLQIFSDLHVELTAFAGPAPGSHADVIVLAGDIHSPAHKVPTWARRESLFGAKSDIVFVPGNHEFYGTVVEDEAASLLAECERNQVTLLQCTERVIDGVRFLGCTLWTDFNLLGDAGLAMEQAAEKMNDYRRIERRVPAGRGRPASGWTPELSRQRLTTPLTPGDTLAWHWQQRSWLKRALARSAGPSVHSTVVVTHHAPSGRSVPAKYQGDSLSPAFASELLDDVLSTAHQVPALWIHGHIHEAVDYTHSSGCRVFANPRGYNVGKLKTVENDKFDRGLVIEI